MNGPFTRVRPGDLISSDFFNGLIDAYNALDARVKVLEAAGPVGKTVIITGIFPSGPLEIGQEIQVLGRNFIIPANQNTVSVDGILIERFNPGSDDTRLIFNIPSGIQGLPKDAPLTVRNQFGAAMTTISLLAPHQVIPRGLLAIADESGNIGVIQVGQTYTLKYMLDSQTTIGETYLLSPIFSNPVGTATITDWTAKAILVDQASNPLPSAAIKINPGSPVHVGLKVTVPTGATSAYISLLAQSQNNNVELTTPSSPVQFVTGSAPPVNDPRVSFTIEPFGNLSKGKKDNEGRIEIPYNGFARVSVKAEFQVAGNYTYSPATVEPPGDNIWTLKNFGPTAGIKTANDSEVIGVDVSLVANPDPAGGHPEQRFLVFKVSRTDNDGIGHFDSLKRISMIGYIPA